MKEKVISIKQIKEAKRLHRALEITSSGSPTITFPEMLDRVVRMDRMTEVEATARKVEQMPSSR